MMKKFSIFNFQFSILIAIFTLAISVTPAYAQTGPSNFNITYSPSCTTDSFTGQITAALSWTNPPNPPAYWVIRWSTSSSRGGLSTKTISGSSTQTSLPDGFGVSFYGGPTSIDPGVSNYLSFYPNNDSDPTASYSFTYTTNPCPTPSPIPTPTPIPATPCNPDDTTFTVSPNPTYYRDILTFAFNPAHANQSVTFSPSPYSGDYTGNNYMWNAMLQNCTPKPITSSPFTCTASRPNPYNPEIGSGSVTYNWWNCGNGLTSCSQDSTFASSTCSKTVSYFYGPRPLPAVPQVCRIPNSDLIISRATINSSNEWFYVLYQQTTTGRAFSQFFTSVGEMALQANTSALFSVGSLNLNQGFTPVICNWPTSFGGISIPANCTQGTVFCIPGTGGTCSAPPECVVPPPVYCGSGQERATGLVSAPDIQGNFGSTGACIKDPKVAFAPYEIPTYNDLKSIYYTQSKAPKSSNSNTNISPVTQSDDGKVFNYTASDVNINGTYNYNGTAVIFIDGNLNINKNIASDPTKGLVLVVRGNVNIDPTVTRIDAVIISTGTIFTAGANCGYDPANPDVAQLVVNGGLVSLDGNKPIKFCRKTALDATDPAEKIVHEPKYLIILRNLFARSEQFWSELTGAEALPTAIPTPAPTATPVPTATPTPLPMLPAPTPSRPICSSTAGDYITLSWSSVEGANFYRFDVKATSNPWSGASRDYTPNTTQSYGVLVPGTSYSWRVASCRNNDSRCYDPALNSSFFALGTDFTCIAPTPTPT